MLSVILLTYVCWQTFGAGATVRNWGPFLAPRPARIYPLHLATLLLVLALEKFELQPGRKVWRFRALLWCCCPACLAGGAAQDHGARISGQAALGQMDILSGFQILFR